MRAENMTMKKIRTLAVALLSVIACGQLAYSQQYAFHPGDYGPAAYSSGVQPGMQGAIQPVNYSEYGAYSEEVIAPDGIFGADAGGCHTCGQGTGCGCGSSRMWASLEALGWWTKGSEVPVLMTGDPSAALGVLPTATTLFGGGPADYGIQAGARLDFGFWLDNNECLGLGFRVYGLDQGTSNISSSAATTARPFFNLTGGANAEDAYLISSTEGGRALVGTLDIELANELIATSFYVKRALYQNYGNRIDFLAGYQFSRMDDSVSFSTTQVDNAGGQLGPINTTRDAFEFFDTRNDFHGGDLGFLSKFSDGKVTWTLLTKLGIGSMRQKVKVFGFSEVDSGGGGSPSQTAGDLLTMPTNIGTYTRDRFVLVPELGINMNYQVKRNVALTLGYTFVYWSNVVRATEQIDRNVNLSQANGGTLTGTPGPTFSWADSHYWVQGINGGVVVTY
jgi:hypothetical protein